MTDQTFDTAAHPRTAATGRFTDAPKTTPEVALTAPMSLQDQALADVEAVTGGREALERAIGAGRFGWIELTEARNHVWEGAGGPAAGLMKLEPHLISQHKHLDADTVERILEVTYYRAQSGRYTRPSFYSDIEYTAVDADELRVGDYLAEARGSYVTARWNDGEPVGPEAEITDDVARLFAEDALASLPDTTTIVDFPRLAEFAVQPYSGDAGTSDEKVAALHAELSTIRNAHDYLYPRQHVRLDMLATYALHALPGQD
ncbi:hypothetical protein [Microbacterium sp. 77mftsu3.1]|uniref:hypothetical protein n=1 Tax=Microbacterium sp. 77mftsu3.1 TaxID=1761802 RepID=UPI00058DA37F|nr:hypothetical protein [Microbacterium sp. 77mftsu3.1]